MIVHLNGQNGIRYDQDKTFGVENLRSAFNQVKVLKENDYGSHGGSMWACSMAKGILATAEGLKSPVIIGTAEVLLPTASL